MTDSQENTPTKNTGMPGLPDTGDGVVAALKEANDKKDYAAVKSLTSTFLTNMLSHYDSSREHARISDASDNEIYAQIAKTQPKEKIPKLVCGPSHQLLVNFLHQAGIENARTVQTGIKKGHIGLLYSLEPGKWIFNGAWGKSVEFEADNIVAANRIASAISPDNYHRGVNTIMSRNGEHIAYTENTLAEITGNNPDKNNHLKDPVKLLDDNSANGTVDAKSSAFVGKNHPVFGNYESESLSATYKTKTQLSDKTDLKVQWEVTADKASTEKITQHTPDLMTDKKVGYDILGTRVSAEIATTIPVSKDVKLQPFAYADAGGYVIQAHGTVKTKTGETISEKTVGISSGDNYASAVVGERLKIGNPNGTNASATIFGGLRLNNDKNVYEGDFKLSPASILGVDGQANLNLMSKNGYKLDLPMGASAVDTHSAYSDVKKMDAQAGLALRKDNTSIYATAGGRRQEVTITGLPGKDVVQSPYVGAGVSTKVGPAKISLDGSTAGKSNFLLGLKVTGVF